MNDVVRCAARRDAACLGDVVLKLVLWREADPEAGEFSNAWDMLPFSAYHDLLTLTGQKALAHPADEKALAAMWNDD